MFNISHKKAHLAANFFTARYNKKLVELSSLEDEIKLLDIEKVIKDRIKETLTALSAYYQYQNEQTYFIDGNLTVIYNLENATRSVKMNHQRFMFLRSLNNHPVGCVAMQLNTHDNTVSYQLSVKNPLDTFDRVLARHIATERLKKHPVVVKLPQNATMHEISFAVMTDLANSVTAPTRAVKASKLWLSSPRPEPVSVAELDK